MKENNKIKVKVLLDSNFILAIFNYKWNVFSMLLDFFFRKVEFYIIPDTLSEVCQVIEKSKILPVLEKFKINLLHIEFPRKMKVDDKLLKVAEEQGMYLATLDRKLRHRAKELGIKTITLTKGGKILVI